MDERYVRTIALIGQEGFYKIKKSHILVFGIGGVGGYVVESLVRCGVGTITIVDFDKVDITNINRQIIATTDTVGRYKVDVMEERIKAIDPATKVIKKYDRVDENSIENFDLSQYDYIIDAIDDIKGKLLIIEKSKLLNKNIISSMGAGKKLNPGLFQVADISKTSVCPLAKVMRKAIKEKNIQDVKVVYSKEEPIKGSDKRILGSISFVPASAGLLISSEVIKDIIGGR
ncbi:MAG: ThiF family adenylyltransferase [Peptostreptococcales bacterium]